MKFNLHFSPRRVKIFQIHSILVIWLRATAQHSHTLYNENHQSHNFHEYMRSEAKGRELAK